MNEEQCRNFKAINGYIDDLKKRNNLKLVKLSGEMNTLSDEAYEQIMAPFRDDLQQLMTKFDVNEEYVFNADQTGNYYRRFSCTTICFKDRIKYIKGTKAMKNKDRSTSMVCTSTKGINTPLRVSVGQSVLDIFPMSLMKFSKIHQ